MKSALKAGDRVRSVVRGYEHLRGTILQRYLPHRFEVKWDLNENEYETTFEPGDSICLDVDGLDRILEKL